MCCVSNMGDYWRDQIPWVGDTPLPSTPKRIAELPSTPWWDTQSFNLLQEILRLCKQLDEKMEQRDCEQDEKMEYFKKVGEKIGVPFDLDKVDSLNFGRAIELMKQGHKVARSGWNGWNGKGIYIFLQKDVGEGWNDYIVMKAADGNMQPGWLASQKDMLSNDWIDLGIL